MLHTENFQSIFASFDLPELNCEALANEAPCWRYCTIVQKAGFDTISAGPGSGVSFPWATKHIPTTRLRSCSFF